MDKTFFLRHYGILLSAKSVLIDTDVAELTYQAYQNDFTDEEFAAVCLMVLKNENFYGRPPDPAIFSKYVKTSALETDFIEKCADYLQQSYVSSERRDAFIENLTDREERALYSFGGISTLWSICHPNGMFNPDRFDFKLKSLREVFRSTVVPEQKQLPDIDTKMVEQIKRITSSVLKRMT